MTTVNRRSWLAGAAALGGGAILGGCKLDLDPTDDRKGSSLSGRQPAWTADYPNSGADAFMPRHTLLAGGQLIASVEGQLIAYQSATGAKKWESPYGPLVKSSGGIDLATTAGLVLSLRMPIPEGEVPHGTAPPTLPSAPAVYAVDAKTGALRWHYVCPAAESDAQWVDGPYAVGEYVVLNVVTKLYVLSATNGRLLWTRQLALTNSQDDLAPLGDKLYLTVAPDPAVFTAEVPNTLDAYDLATGQDVRSRPIDHTGHLAAADNGLYLLDTSQQLSCFDPATSRKRWSVAAESALDDHRPLVVAGGFILWKTRDPDGAGLVAHDTATGKRVWRVSLPKDLTGEVPPVVVGDTVGVVAGKSLIALSLQTGSKRWTATIKGALSLCGLGGGAGRFYAFDFDPVQSVLTPHRLYAIPI